MRFHAILLSVLLCVTVSVHGQDEQRPKVFEQGVSLSFLGSAFPLGISYSRSVSKRDVIEAGIGLGYLVILEPPSFGLAYKRYVKDIELDKVQLYTGISVTDILSPLDTPGPFITVPLGFGVHRKKLIAEFHVGPTILPNEDWIVAIYGGISVGLSF